MLAWIWFALSQLLSWAPDLTGTGNLGCGKQAGKEPQPPAGLEWQDLLGPKHAVVSPLLSVVLEDSKLYHTP